MALCEPVGGCRAGSHFFCPRGRSSPPDSRMGAAEGGHENCPPPPSPLLPQSTKNQQTQNFCGGSIIAHLQTDVGGGKRRRWWLEQAARQGVMGGHKTKKNTLKKGESIFSQGVLWGLPLEAGIELLI